MEALFGTQPLLKSTKEGDTVPVSSLKGKVVGIYFSAHWCGPCRSFTPRLIESYKSLKAQGKNFEIVFVSSDRDEEAFEEYYGSMPWLSLSYEHRDIKQKLSRKYKVEGIPTFVIVDEEGNLITKDGREAISQDPKGDKFPWKPKTLNELLGDHFVKNDGTKVPKSQLDGKVLGLYFSAHWCGPCRHFTPQLISTYKALQAAKKPFEIIFVSSDRDESAWKEYFGEMPWLGLPYSNRESKAELSSLFSVEGIPTLVILDENRKTISLDGRSAVSADPSGAEFPWIPKPVNDLDENPGAINDVPSLVLFMESFAASKQGEMISALTAIGEELKKSAGSDDPEFALFYAKKQGQISSQVRTITSSSGNAPTLVLVDIPDNGGYYKYTGDVSACSKATLEKFIADYRAKKLTRIQLSRA